MLNSTKCEIWKPINTNKNYFISNKGRVKNSKGKILKTYIINSGYKAIKINNKHYLIHRLVAEHFIPNKYNKSEVNHKDGNKLNNNVKNLEWVTSSENKKHAKDIGLKVYNYPTLGVKKGKTSTFNNVFYDKSRSKWIGTVRNNGKNILPKRFDTPEEAAYWVNLIIEHFNLKNRKLNNVNISKEKKEHLKHIFIKKVSK